METVFITIHDLSLDARIRYASDSVEDVLGYLPQEVKGKSCWEYFHPDEIPFARAVHGRGINLDKASVLTYCQIKHKDGSWVGCECCFTVVYDVLVASTSIYKRGPRSKQRAIDGKGVRRIFSSSPRDPRYHMLSFISSKFYREPRPDTNEPRAAFFLNRFSRASNIMFATNGVMNILGLRPGQLVGKSFYYCIAENCLSDAIRCVESAKANDSIAYLRFWFRDPTQQSNASVDQQLSDDEEDDDGGVRIQNGDATDAPTTALPALSPTPSLTPLPAAASAGEIIAPSPSAPRPSGESAEQSRASSGTSTDLEGSAADTIFDRPAFDRASSQSVTPAEDLHDGSGAVEIEAVVSCSSDGLVVILRRARPLIPHVAGTTDVPHYANGLFASPWATEPVLPPHAPSIIPPEAAEPAGVQPEPLSFMSAIREVAVFAWCLTGINGTLAQYSRGTPTGEALPPGGLPVWDPSSNADPDNKYNGFLGSVYRPFEGMENEEVAKKDADSTSSDDEVLWKRVPVMPSYKKPARRRHSDAFGADEEVEEREPQSRTRQVGEDKARDAS